MCADDGKQTRGKLRQARQLFLVKYRPFLGNLQSLFTNRFSDRIDAALTFQTKIMHTRRQKNSFRI